MKLIRGQAVLELTWAEVCSLVRTGLDYEGPNDFGWLEDDEELVVKITDRVVSDLTAPKKTATKKTGKTPTKKKGK